MIVPLEFEHNFVLFLLKTKKGVFQWKKKTRNLLGSISCLVSVNFTKLC